MIETQKNHWERSSGVSVYITALSASLIFIYSIFWIDVTILPDYDNYLLWAIEFQEKSWAELGFIEFLSFAQIKFFGSLGSSVDMGLQKLYIFNAFMAAIGFFGLSVRYGRTVSGVGLAYVLYGPLLSYVTLRATPAYLLVSWFILIRKGVISKLLLMTISFLYHVTAIIPVFLVAGVSFLKLSTWLSVDDKKSRLQFLIGSILFLGICIELIWNLGLGDDIARFLFRLTVATDKFQEYLDMASLYRSKAHFGYFIFVLVTTCFYLYMTFSLANNFWWSMLLALVIFIFLSISPVVAYRFSIFFLLPIFLTFPKTKNALEFSLFCIVFCVGLIIGAFQAIGLFNG